MSQIVPVPYHTGYLIKLTTLRHLPHSLDRAVDRHLRHLRILLHLVFRLLRALLQLWMPPFKGISHLEIVLAQRWAVGADVGDDAAVWLPEVHCVCVYH